MASNKFQPINLDFPFFRLPICCRYTWMFHHQTCCGVDMNRPIQKPAQSDFISIKFATNQSDVGFGYCVSTKVNKYKG